MIPPSDSQADDWFGRRTILGQDRPVAQLIALEERERIRVSVCLPALDEAATIGLICTSIDEDLVRPGVVDELIVVDSGSEDDTRELASAAGAKVYTAEEILPGIPAAPARPGKGEAMWKSLAVATGDIVVWIDSDIRNFSTQFVTRLLWPLLEDPSLVMTKGFYERPLEDATDGAGTRDDRASLEGGRVTELAARPLLGLLFPLLGHVIQPLSGEYAMRRSAALEVPFVSGYGVDVALLIDVVARYGVDALAQVDLGRRVHRNRDLLSLGRTSFQVMRAMLQRLQALGLVDLGGELPTSLTQFAGSDPLRGAANDLDMAVRPPMIEVEPPH